MSERRLFGTFDKKKLKIGYPKIYNTEPQIWANFKSIFQNSGYFDYLASRTDKNYSICGIIGGLQSGTIPVYYVAKFWEICT